jgi:hypothetical protein
LELTRGRDALGGRNRQPEIEIERVEIVVQLGDAAPHAPMAAHLCSCGETVIHRVNLA